MRGINVGGKNLLPMRDLRALLDGLGLHDPRTYIQSGNCVFSGDRSAADLAEEIGGAVAAKFGFRPAVTILSRDRLQAAITATPWPGEDPKTVHLYFPAGTPAKTPDLDALERLRASSERFALLDGIFYLHAPGGIGRSKLAAQAERNLKVPVTARNLRTVLQIAALAG